ncbi:MAG TPA: helix-turn-helix transcriptional regulator [Streptosporangiaceae bacterium]|nr:helix-turn-helix transcriptional regulator [Streptosporangiaceae bacterium]
MDFGDLLSSLMTERGLGVRALARHVPCDPSLISRLASGQQRPSAQIARRLDEILSANGELSCVAAIEMAIPAAVLQAEPGLAEELAAIEAARRADATDVGRAAVERLEKVADALALAYASTRPTDLLTRTLTYLDYTTSLLDGRMTLSEHRRLLVTAGWLSLLASTSLTDLGRLDAAEAHLRTAAQVAVEAGHAELRAWCLETTAWQALIGRDYREAATLAAGAQSLAPGGSSAMVQSAAQEGRAWARLGAKRETLAALARVETLVSPMAAPEHPEHHYRYDPSKAEAYLATTLAWIADPAAEGYARNVLHRIESGADGTVRPRRAATARLDLALALTTAGRPDEAAGTAQDAIASGLLVASHLWRVREVISAVAEHDPEAAVSLREALAAARPAPQAIETRKPPAG